ncbi:MAG: hypothetical protein OK436_03395 [Thaumarchaeota archaeon]|nr:hypothetical protein [Nitrososphaerota archaeon]
MGEKEKGKESGPGVHLSWKDYLALVVALLETVLAPLLILIVFLLVVVIWVTGHL